MRILIVRWLFLTVAILIASHLIEGVKIAGFLTALLAAATLGMLNVLLKPLLILLTLPINLITLGLFTFVINAGLLKMTTGVIPGFEVQGFWPAVLAAIVISIVNWALSVLVPEQK